MDITELFPWLFGAGWVLFAAFMILCTSVPFLLVFGGLGYYFYRSSRKAAEVRSESAGWQSTRGVIIKSRVEVSGGETTSVLPRVVYEYDVAGRRYQGEQIRAGDTYFSMRSSRDAYDTIDRYPVGMAVEVFYDPDDPNQAALER